VAEMLLAQGSCIEFSHCESFRMSIKSYKINVHINLPFPLNWEHMLCTTYLKHDIQTFEICGFTFNNASNDAAIHRHPLCFCFSIYILKPNEVIALMTEDSPSTETWKVFNFKCPTSWSSCYCSWNALLCRSTVSCVVHSQPVKDVLNRTSKFQW
jgi:hypothetical protein